MFGPEEKDPLSKFFKLACSYSSLPFRKGKAHNSLPKWEGKKSPRAGRDLNKGAESC